MSVGKLYIVSGPSGAGKGTLVRAILGRVPDIWLSVSATTRRPRPGEEEGKHYIFLSTEDFDDLVEHDGLLEWADVHGNRYGTPRAPVEKAIAQGKRAVLEIDPQGAFQVKKRMPESKLIFITPPAFEDLRDRLQGRGSETESEIERRLGDANSEMEFADTYDFVVINDDVRKAADELAAIIEGELTQPTHTD
jgi:guanylate kinase